MDNIRSLREEFGDDNDHHLVKGERSTTDVPYAGDSLKNVESIQFPNGKNKYRIEGKDHQIGWATYQYGHNENKNKVSTSYKQCLGTFKCPVAGCGFCSRPRLPTGKGCRRKGGTPRPPKVTHCQIHHQELVLMPCDVTMKVKTHPDEDYVEIDHHGTH